MGSNFLNLNLNDLFKGFLVAVITSVLVAMEPLLVSGKLPDLPTLKAVAIAGVGAGIAYLVKNAFTNSQGQLLKPEVKPPVG
jgi:ABC-type uncharacterized transport system permease subunit